MQGEVLLEEFFGLVRLLVLADAGVMPRGYVNTTEFVKRLEHSKCCFYLFISYYR